MVDWQLRLRAFLNEQFAIVVAVLLVFALLGGWMTYTAYAAPEPATEQRSTVQWEQTGDFHHTATVTEDNSVFPTGTTLDNRSVYFTRLSPQLDGTFDTSYDARQSGELDQAVSLSLVIRGVEADDQGDNETVHWQTTDSLGDSTVDAVSPGEAVSVEFSQNMSAVDTQIDQIRDEIGSSPGETEVFVRAAVTSQGTVNGDGVNETNTYRLPVTLDGNIYRIGNPEPTVEQYETIQTETVAQSAGATRSIGGPLLVVISLGLLGGVVALFNRGPLSESERAQMAYENDRETFDDWISTIQLPEEAFDLPQATAGSLGALVDFAIDTDNSVIKDPDETAYYVRHDGYLYTYRPSVQETVTAEGQPSGENTKSTNADDESLDHPDNSSEPDEPAHDTKTDG